MKLATKIIRYLDALLRGRIPRGLPTIQVFQHRSDAMDRALLNIQVGTRLGRSQPANVRSDSRSLVGHYVEFGVYQGTMLAYVAKRAEELMPWMHFYAFDSFEGLPETHGADASGEFEKGQFSSSQEDLEAYLKWKKVPMDRVHVVPGWFNETLTDEMAAREGLDVVSVAFIDCDLYESCVPVLEFLTSRLRQGSILLYDDWYNFRADPRRGVRRATEEWLEKQDRFTLEPWFSFSHHAKAFFVLDREHESGKEGK